MRPNLLLGFFVSALAMSLLLFWVSFDDQKSALLRLDEILTQDTEFKEVLASHCQVLEGTPFAGTQGATGEKFIIGRYSSKIHTEGQKTCSLRIKSASRARFGLQGNWNFSLELKAIDGERQFLKNYAIEFPRPKTLLPLALFFLAVVFEFPFWGWLPMLCLYLVLIEGGNPIHLLAQAQRSLSATFQTEGTLPGLILLSMWVAIATSRLSRTRIENATTLYLFRKLKGIAGTLVGLWNPIAFTITAPLLIVFRGASHRLISFFDAQVLLTALSLYLLSLDVTELSRSLLENALTPRYLTLALFIFLILPLRSSQRTADRFPFSPQSLPRAILCIMAIEAVNYFLLLPVIQISVLSRISLALLLSEVVWPWGVHWKRAWGLMIRWVSCILLVSWLSVFVIDRGVPQMVFGLMDPRMHPTAMVFFTYMGSMLLAVVSGSFTASYFPFLALLSGHQGEPLIRAALIEGILAGLFLSPLSLFNLMPAVQFKLKMRELIALRIQQLGFPLLISTIIYAVSAMSSVAILRPATFIFLCLLGLFVHLRKQRWRIGEWFNGNLPA